MLSRRSLGVLDAVTIGRYAMTIGATDPIHHDAAAARSAGYADVVAPPNLLAAIVEWGIGTPEADLQADGTPNDGETPLGDPGLGLRVMGAGEEMELVNPVVAGTELLESTLAAVTPKQTRPAPACSSPRSTPSRQPTAPCSTATGAPSCCATPPGVVMPVTFEIGDAAAAQAHRDTLQLFRTAVTWNPHRIHFDESYAREEGHAGLALHSHLRAARRALRHRGPRPDWQVTKFAYRLRKPVHAPADLAYTARVTAADGDSLTLELIEEPLRRAWVRRHGGSAGPPGRRHDRRPGRGSVRSARELLGLLRRPRLGHGRHGPSRRHRRPHR